MLYTHSFLTVALLVFGILLIFVVESPRAKVILASLVGLCWLFFGIAGATAAAALLAIGILLARELPVTSGM